MSALSLYIPTIRTICTVPTYRVYNSTMVFQHTPYLTLRGTPLIWHKCAITNICLKNSSPPSFQYRFAQLDTIISWQGDFQNVYF